jgi:hypothetical protein
MYRHSRCREDGVMTCPLKAASAWLLIDAAAAKGSGSSKALLFLLEYVDGEAIGIHLAGPVGPKAIHLIAIDALNGHQWPSRTQPDEISTPEHGSGQVLRGCG